MSVTMNDVGQAMINLLRSKVDPNPKGQEYMFGHHDGIYTDFSLQTLVATVSLSTRLAEGEESNRFRLLEVFCADHLPDLSFKDYGEILDLVRCRRISRQHHEGRLRILNEMEISTQDLADLINLKSLNFVSVVAAPTDFKGRKARIVIGLPASGKTHYAQSLGAGWTVVDDPMGPQDLPAHFVGDVVITSPHFCRDTTLRLITDDARQRWPGITIEHVFFANDPDACLINAAQRPEKRVDGFIRLLTKTYAPPADARPVWTPPAEEPCPSG